MSIDRRRNLIQVRMRGASMHGQVDKVVRNIEARRTRVTDVVKILLTGGEETGVYSAAGRKKDQPVEESHNVRARLVDGENHGAVVGLGQSHQTLDDIEGIESVLDTVSKL